MPPFVMTKIINHRPNSRSMHEEFKNLTAKTEIDSLGAKKLTSRLDSDSGGVENPRLPDLVRRVRQPDDLDRRVHRRHSRLRCGGGGDRDSHRLLALLLRRLAQIPPRWDVRRRIATPPSEFQPFAFLDHIKIGSKNK
ncbi:HXXXD-type acyl-transferase family protein [Striga asiatica]|uniref:HXXXD-type acyl-transferase family protein n=1 Tax=Striga asiatica TaxID=4170 RepID=A0A5A7RJ14_STRAF|nr:HXXXD-type acyl-transferase family protein [Striga asiatica]